MATKQEEEDLLSCQKQISWSKSQQAREVKEIILQPVAANCANCANNTK